MVDNLSPQDRQKTMRSVKGKLTKPERQLFSMLAGMGVSGWRRNLTDVIGKPDAAFIEDQLAIFVDGCFWHGCPYCKRKLPETNRLYWKEKIRRNVKRAKRYNQQLLEDGWRVVRIWEHEIVDPNQRHKIRTRIIKALRRAP